MLYIAFTPFSAFDPDSLLDLEHRGLGQQEQDEYARLRVPKRKGEWLASRLTVKRLALTCMPGLAAQGLADVQILKEPTGAPYLHVTGRGKLRSGLSLSHSHEHVLAALSSEPLRIGVDLEWIEPRPAEFLTDYFNEGEIAQVKGTIEQRALLTTLLWSAKEAVLKALSEGLRIDTRKLEVRLATVPPHADGWNELALYSSDLKIPSPRLFWCREGEFILTYCVLDGCDPQLLWVTP